MPEGLFSFFFLFYDYNGTHIRFKSEMSLWHEKVWNPCYGSHFLCLSQNLLIHTYTQYNALDFIVITASHDVGSSIPLFWLIINYYLSLLHLCQELFFFQKLLYSYYLIFIKPWRKFSHLTDGK